MREADVERYLVKRVKALGGEVRKVRWIGRRNAPDRVVMIPIEQIHSLQWSPTIWVELKAPGKKPRIGQLREHERMRGVGQRVVVIDTIEAVDELLV